MDTPFNFERNRREGKESNYIKGKNQITSEKATAEAIEGSDQEIRVLLEKAVDNLGTNSELTDQEVNEMTEQYADADPVTRQRRYLLQLLLETPQVHQLPEDLTTEEQGKIKNFLQVILSGESVFQTGELRETINLENLPEDRKPIGIISELYTVIRYRFHEDFFTSITILDIIPQKIISTEDGSITHAEFSLDIDPEGASQKFYDLFHDAKDFHIFYDYNSNQKSRHKLQLIGFTTAGVEVKRFNFDLLK
ncbi:MAG: hypothetical protein WD335_02955 [Candidatus Paceibacterota bacterium]